MDKLKRWLGKAGLLIAISIMLVACSKVTRENFEKVKPGMTTKEVIAILGEPTGSDSVDIAGVTGTASTWKRGDMVISVHFLSDQVLVKTLDKPSDRHNAE